MRATSQFLNLRLRDMAEAIDDIAKGRDSRTLFDEPERLRHCKSPGCEARLETSHEHSYGRCWACLRENA